MSSLNGQPAIYSSEAEEATLGCVLISPEALHDATAIINDPADFYLHKHRWIWQALIALDRAGKKIDFITVADYLESKNQLKEIGGAGYLTQLINVIPTALHVESYASIVASDAFRRRLMESATAIAKLAYAEGRDVAEIAGDANAVLLAATNTTITARHIHNQPDSFQEFYEDEVKTLSGDDPISRVSTGYKSIDRRIGGGYSRKKLHIIHGWPGLGKTSMLATGSYNQSRSGLRVAVFPLEDGRQDWIAAYTRSKLGIDPYYRQAKSESRSSDEHIGRLQERDIDRLTEFAPDAQVLPIAYCEGGERLDAKTLRQRLSTMVMRELDGNVDVVYVDHLYHLRSNKSQNDSLAIAETCIELSAISKEFNCAVVVIAQDNKESMKHSGPPNIADLYMSHGIYHICRFLAAVHPDEDHEMYRESWHNWRELGNTWVNVPYNFYVQKNNNGPVGVIPMFYNPAFRRFVEVDDVAPDPLANVKEQSRNGNGRHVDLVNA
jgi:replicative DNA helicase